MTQKTLKNFLTLAFNVKSDRAKEILKKMRDLDEPKITMEDYIKVCLETIATNSAEELFVVFTAGSLYGEYKTEKRYEAN